MMWVSGSYDAPSHWSLFIRGFLGLFWFQIGRRELGKSTEDQALFENF